MLQTPTILLKKSRESFITEIVKKLKKIPTLGKTASIFGIRGNIFNRPNIDFRSRTKGAIVML